MRPLFVLVALLSIGPVDLIPRTAEAFTQFDCLGDSPECAELAVEGDAPSRFSNGLPTNFRGFADPCLRHDPTTGTIWMAYSWPDVHVVGPVGNRFFVPSVDIHLARGADGGETWRLDRGLIESYRDHDVEGDQELGFTGHEVVNILPRESEGGSSWYAAWIDYFVPDETGFSGRPISSIRIRITRIDLPGGFADPSIATLGAVSAAQGWGLDMRPALSRCLASLVK